MNDEALRRIREANAQGLTSLDLRHLELVELPEELAQLSALTQLDLEYNRLASLPAWFAKLASLHTLVLSNNALKVVPEVLSELPGLTALVMNGNAVQHLPIWLTDLPLLSRIGIAKNPIAQVGVLQAIAPRLQQLEIDNAYLMQLVEQLDTRRLESLDILLTRGETLPQKLCTFTLLTRLRLRGQCSPLGLQLSELKRLKQLKRLVINCGLEVLPESLAQLSQLQTLDISGNQLSALPEGLAQLTQLQNLDVSGNQLGALPESLAQLTQLQFLDVSRNQLSALPESLAQLTQLQSLFVSLNQLSALPEGLTQLTQLQSLDVSRNQLRALPKGLSQLSQLHTLNVSGNALSALPEGLTQLTQLQNLFVSRTQLSALPEGLAQLSHLQTLDIWGNQLRTLPEGLTQLTHLQSLDVTGNQLSALPEGLAQLTQLLTLNVTGNQLTVLPEGLAQLSQLQTLIVTHNQLRALPEGLAQLSQLHSLNVSHNQLHALPEGIGQLTELQTLDVSGNQLNALPEGIGQLTQLQTLEVSHNQLSVLPEGLAQLSNLQALYISGNQLSALPEGIGQLLSLTMLDAAKNQLANLPVTIRDLPLQQLWLQDNPGLNLSAALLGKYVERYVRYSMGKIRSPAAILEAFFSAHTLDGQPLDEIKLVLVGRGAAGKTTLAHRLIRDKFRRGTKETQGVDISAWPLRCGDRDIDVNVWDFAGQVVTHSTHQFFLSESSVYLLVLTGREDSQQIDSEYWLRLIRAFATDAGGKTSPVIVALNKFDEHPFKVDRNSLREKYPFIVDFIETDCKSALGIPEMREKLAATIKDMPIVQQRFKLNWWNIKRTLEKTQKKKNYLPYSSFQAICVQHGEADLEQQRFLAEVFHALGVALNYGSDTRLRNATVLNPRWVTGSIYKLLREAVRDDGSAELTLARVAEVLPKEPPEMRTYLVELMRRFDLAFPLNESGDRWLVPQRLPAEQPELGEDWLSPSDATRLRFSYPVIPEGLLPRFISRTYPLSEGEEDEPSLPRWAKGVVLQDRDARALIRIDEEERRINVVVKGPKEERLFLLGVIQADFRSLHEQISGLGQTEELEVEDHPGVFVPVLGLIADELRGLTESSASTIEGSISFGASAQLNRLSEPPARRDEWRPRVFISYSSTDARLKDDLLVRLKPMQATQGLVDVWEDRCIIPGEDWDGVIRKELEIADVVLLMVSPKFLASNYINGVEVAAAVSRAKAGEALVIPIILEKCGYKHAPFGHFNALPRKGQPVRDRKPQRNAWYEIEEELRNIFSELRSHRDMTAMRHPSLVKKDVLNPFDKGSR